MNVRIYEVKLLISSNFEKFKIDNVLLNRIVQLIKIISSKRFNFFSSFTNICNF